MNHAPLFEGHCENLVRVKTRVYELVQCMREPKYIVSFKNGKVVRVCSVCKGQLVKYAKDQIENIEILENGK